MNRDQLIEYISGKFGDKIEPLKTGPVEPVFLLKDNSFLPEFCRTIKNDLTLQIDYLCNMAAVDTGEKFEVVYNVASVEKNIRFDFKLTMPFEGAEVDSVQDIWPAANWYEREMWELYGINIKNHGNLTRFLLPDDWNQGNPMRKNWDAPDFIRMPEL